MCLSPCVEVCMFVYWCVCMCVCVSACLCACVCVRVRVRAQPCNYPILLLIRVWQNILLHTLSNRKLRQTRPQQTMFNLALAELCSWIVFLAGINQIGDHNGCIVVAVLLHYFILVSFMWMLVEAVLHYILFVKVLGTYTPRFMLKTAIPAWGKCWRTTSICETFVKSFPCACLNVQFNTFDSNTHNSMYRLPRCTSL